MDVPRSRRLPRARVLTALLAVALCTGCLSNDSTGPSGTPNPYALPQHWPEAYIVDLGYWDVGPTATSVHVSGPGITGSPALSYDADIGAWLLDPPVSLGAAYPAGLPYTYTFTIADAGGTRTATDVVSCFQSQLPTNLSPAGTASGTPTFSWTGINDPRAEYRVQLNTSSLEYVWGTRSSFSTAVVYAGPALTPGASYTYWVIVEYASSCGSASVGRATFTYQ